MTEGQHDGAEPVSDEARPRRGRPGLLAARVLIALLSATALVAVGVIWFNVERLRGNTNTTDALQQLQHELATVPNQPPVDDGATDILLVGTDSRTDLQGNPLPNGMLKQLRTEWDAGLNTDTLILLRIPNNGGQAFAVSIPRDSYVSIPGVGMNKINGAYGITKEKFEQQSRDAGETDLAKIERDSDEAGQVALLATVQNLTGVHIDHYAEVGLYGFYLISQAIGGVPVCLLNATQDKDSGADFPAGYQVISGGDALSFVRQRKNLPDGDLDRIIRQQVFLESAVRKLLTAGVLVNPTARAGMVDAVRKSLVTDPGLDILGLAQQAQALTSGNVTFKTIPVANSNGRSPIGQSIVVVDPHQVRQFFTSMVPSSPAPTGPTSSSRPTAAGPATPEIAPAAYIAEPASINGVRCVS
ncbi:MAG TPA: LCP family protein [Pseudonocardiaceae bacterium]|jgi:LCP family protein required for cell wall assembly|nr:LCP family protein [Pseudonocardiaceae bacterium]